MDPTTLDLVLGMVAQNVTLHIAHNAELGRLQTCIEWLLRATPSLISHSLPTLQTSLATIRTMLGPHGRAPLPAKRPAKPAKGHLLFSFEVHGVTGRISHSPLEEWLACHGPHLARLNTCIGGWDQYILQMENAVLEEQERVRTSARPTHRRSTADNEIREGLAKLSAARGVYRDLVAMHVRQYAAAVTPAAARDHSGSATSAPGGPRLGPG